MIARILVVLAILVGFVACGAAGSRLGRAAVLSELAAAREAAGDKVFLVAVSCDGTLLKGIKIQVPHEGEITIDQLPTKACKDVT